MEILLAQDLSKDNEVKLIKVQRLKGMPKNTHHLFYRWIESGKKNNIQHIYEYRMAGFYFNIKLIKRDDLKKLKYQVIITGASEKFVPGWCTTVLDVNYVINKYDKSDRNQKFTTLQGAKECIELWKQKLLDAHKEDLEWQVPIFEEIKYIA